MFYLIVGIIILGAYIWGLLDVLRRKNYQWVHSARGRTFWLVWMIVGIVYALARFSGFPIPFQSLVSFILVVGFVYYAGPERQRMGPPGGGFGGGSNGPRRPRQDRGGW